MLDVSSSFRPSLDVYIYIYIYICAGYDRSRRHFTNVCVCFCYENVVGILMKQKIENTIYTYYLYWCGGVQIDTIIYIYYIYVYI